MAYVVARLNASVYVAEMLGDTGPNSTPNSAGTASEVECSKVCEALVDVPVTPWTPIIVLPGLLTSASQYGSAARQENGDWRAWCGRLPSVGTAVRGTMAARLSPA